MDALAWLNLIPLWAGFGVVLKLHADLARLGAVNAEHSRRLEAVERQLEARPRWPAPDLAR